MKEDVSSNSTFIFWFQARMSVKRPKEDLGLSSDLCDKMILIFNTLEVQQLVNLLINRKCICRYSDYQLIV